MITILGASGFIGSHIVQSLQDNNIDYYAPQKYDDLANINLGNIIYCIGLTADFRSKPFETIEAHVCKLSHILKNCSFDSLTYLSSTRVYINASSQLVKETDKLTVDPLNADDLYTLSKLTGESLCVSSKKNIKIVRLSNVIGNSDVNINFLSDIINDIKIKGSFHLRQSLSSAKDYIFINDVVKMLIKIALSGKEKIYNLASGINTNNQTIISELQKYFKFSYTIDENAREIIFPKISNDILCSEFEFIPKKFLEQLSLML